MTILIPLIAIIILVIIHELGHFFGAKAVGVKVLEFAVGFPPRVVSFVKSGTRFSFGALLLGGFVKLKGDEIDSEDNEHDSFSGTKSYKKIIILVAGVLMNFVAAWFIFLVLFTRGVSLPSESLPKSLIDNETKDAPILSIYSIQAGSPADIADLPVKTKITGIQNSSLSAEIFNPTREQFITEAKKGLPLSVAFDGYEEEVIVTPDIINGENRIGVSLVEDLTIKKQFIPAIGSSLIFTSYLSKETMKGFFGAVHAMIVPSDNTGDVPLKDSVTGPIGIVKMLGTTLSEGYSLFLVLVAIISINLAVLNILPLPILDGGRILVVLYESIRRKKISKNAQTVISIIGILIIVSLAVFGTINDLS